MIEPLILSRQWWLSVFLVGIGIHLCASYLKPRLDKLGGWVSRSWATRNAVVAKERCERIDKLTRSRKTRLDAVTEEFRALLSGLMWMGLCCSSYLLALFPVPSSSSDSHKCDPHKCAFELVSLLIGSVGLASGIFHWKRAIKIQIELGEAKIKSLQQEMRFHEQELVHAEEELLHAIGGDHHNSVQSHPHLPTPKPGV